MSRKDFRAYLGRTYLGIAGMAGILMAQAGIAADGDTLPIKKIAVDGGKQVVVEFGGAAGAFPAVPHVLDLPGPNHRIVLDFTDASLDKASLPSAEDLSASFTQALPFVKSVRYSNLENSPKPTARLVLDLPEDVKVKPRVVKLEEGSITISLGDVQQVEPAAAAPSGVAGGDKSAAAPVSETPAPVAAVSASPQAEGWDWNGNNAPAVKSQSEPGVQSAATAAIAVPAAEGAVDAILKPAIAMTGTTSEQSAPAGTPAGAPQTESLAPAGGTAPASEVTPTVAPLAETPAPVESAPPAPEPAVSAPAPEAAVITPVPEAAAAPAPEATVVTPAPEAAAAPVPETTGVSPAPASTAAPMSETEKKLSCVRHYNQAVQMHLSGKLSEAIAEYKAALEGNASLPEAHSNLGLIYNQQHNYAQALSEFRKALAINPKDAITYNGIGAALRAEKDLMGAIKNWQTAVSLDPKLATAHYNLGTAYEIQKEYDKALNSYGQAVKNDYRLGEAYYRMGLIMERKRRPDDAAEQFKEALKVSSDSEYSEDARQRLAYLGQTKKNKVH